MTEYPDNLIGNDQPSEIDLECRQSMTKAGQWLPFETYDLVQCGYPYPDHGEMIIRTSGGTNVAGELLPPKGMWVKAADVIKYLKT